MDKLNLQEVRELIVKINEAMNRIRANRALATRDLKGDGDNALFNLDHIKTHAFYGQQDIQALATLVGLQVEVEEEPSEEE